MSSENLDLPIRQAQKSFDQTHSNLFENIKRVYHPHHADRDFEIIRSFSKKNLNISASQCQKKQQLQSSPNYTKSPSKLFPRSPNKLNRESLLFTPSPQKIANQTIFRKKLTTYHNNFMENVNNNLLASNSYSKIFKDKGVTSSNYSNLAKTKSEFNLINKTKEILNEFSYQSNTNLEDTEDVCHLTPNESQLVRLKSLDEAPKRSGHPNQYIGLKEENLGLLRSELEENRQYIGQLKEEIGKLTRQNEEMELRIVEIGAQQKDVISVIVNKHQNFIEKLIADKNQLSLKCEEYLLELKQQTKRQISFQSELDTIKKLSSNEETQSAYIRINKELADIQSERGFLFDQTNTMNKFPVRTADDELLKQSRKDLERKIVNFNHVPVFYNDRKI